MIQFVINIYIYIYTTVSDWIYVKMAWMSVYKSSAKYVPCIKTSTLPTQDVE